MTRREPSPVAPNLRSELIRAAATLGVEIDAYERAYLCTQIAGLIHSDPRLRDRVAFKGGTVARLADDSPRLSRDLDGIDVLAQQVPTDLIGKVLGDRTVAPFILSVGKPVRASDHLAYNYLVCRTPSGHKTNLKLTVHWVEKPVHRVKSFTVSLPNGQTAVFPVMGHAERVAEKVRAFIDRQLPRDAYDLWWHGGKLTPAGWKSLPRLIVAKLPNSVVLRAGDDVPAAFAAAKQSVLDNWDPARELVLTEPAPPWPDVEAMLDRFLPLLPSVCS